MLMMFALLAAQAQPSPAIPPSADTLRAHPPIVSVPVAPPAPAAPPAWNGPTSLIHLSPPARQRAEALSAEIRADLASGPQRRAATEADRVFRDALISSATDFAVLRRAARAYDDALNYKAHYNERWVDLAQALAPADQALLLKNLPAPMGTLFIPTNPTPPTASMRAQNEIQMSAVAKLREAAKTGEAGRTSDASRIAAAQSDLKVALAAPVPDRLAINRAFDRLSDIRAEQIKARGHAVSEAFESMTPAERKSIAPMIEGIMQMSAFGL